MLLCDTAALRSEKNNNEADGMRGRRRAGKEKEEAIEESAIKGVDRSRASSEDDESDQLREL